MSGSLYNYIEPSGVIVPNLSSLLAQVESEWIGQFGSGFDLDSSTPGGIMIASEVAARSSVAQNNATLANQINPNQAAGMFLDAICALSGLERLADTFTVIDNVTLAGVQGSPIAAGTTIKSPSGDLFNLNEAVTLDPVSGTAIGTYTAQVAGSIAAPTGSWTIVTDVLGLETVTNNTVGTLGTEQQSDQILAVLRRKTLALQSVALMDAGLSRINNLSGVIGSQALENVQNVTATISGVTMVAKSVWFCIDGGSASDIGTALLATKSQGADWNGAQSLAVIDPASGQSYTVKWDLPTPVPLLVQVTVRQGTFVGDITDAVTQAVVDFGNNAISGLQGFGVGQSASPFEIAAGIQSECQGLYVKNVEIATVSSGIYAPAEIAMAIYQKPTIIGANVSVVIV
jgi:hypothetical protein